MLKTVAREHHPFMDDEKAETIRQEFERICKAEGACNATRLWHEARDHEDSPLRQAIRFVYNADVALELHNIGIARRALKSIGTYVSDPLTKETLPVPLFIGVRREREEADEEASGADDDRRFRSWEFMQINRVRKDHEAVTLHVRSIAQAFAARRNELAYVSDRFEFLPSFLEALDSFLRSVDCLDEAGREAAG